MAMAFQMLIRGLDGRTSCLRFPSRTISGSLVQEHMAAVMRIPAEALLIVTGTRVVSSDSFLCASSDGFFPSCSLLLRLRGGKGGFGSLLRGAATKAGQKKTSNFDACRDMSGRRLRHVNAEKKLKEWKAQAKERELEKAANEFLKKQVKKKDDESGCSLVIEKFREETSRAREDVESAVVRGLAEAKKLGKRKIVDDSLPSTSSKRSHIWFSSEMDMIGEDSEDEREGSEDEDVNSEEGNDIEHSEEGSEDEYMDKDSEDENQKEGSEDEKVEEWFEDVKAEGRSECEKDEEKVEERNCCNGLDNGHAEKRKQLMVDIVEGGRYDTSSMRVSADSEHQSPCEEKMEPGTRGVPLCGKSTANENGFCSTPTVETKDVLVQSKLNLDDYHGASELEVLGLEKLKEELQARGLKCGGSLAERAGRLFLLKTIPLEKLDKKHFAKARV